MTPKEFQWTILYSLLIDFGIEMSIAKYGIQINSLHTFKIFLNGVQNGAQQGYKMY